MAVLDGSCADSITSADWVSLSEGDRATRLQALLSWVHQHYMFKVPGNDVVCFEETVFIVQRSCLTSLPHWEATLTVFSVWEQQDWTVKFRLAQNA